MPFGSSSEVLFTKNSNLQKEKKNAKPCNAHQTISWTNFLNN
uniref:Uncharacterized protein n=1 Tax=Rhizophora mucronata TaxID=61149 RepID=A0A2P2IV18_RHIMU